MKADIDLKKQVEAELEWDPSINAAAIGVAVKDGVVTLSGHVDSYLDKFAAERIARRVTGVHAIAQEIDVKLSSLHKRSDTEIAQAAEQAIRWHTYSLADRVQLSVDGGWVKLRGELDWDYQRSSIEKTIRPIAGVVGISNEITLKERPVPNDLKSRIESALLRQARREANRINVSVDGSTVRLSGDVHSWAERDAAQGAVWSAPGVRNVVNSVSVHD